MEGTTLVVTDVDVNELEYDSRFYFILRSRYRFLTSSAPFKLMVRSQANMYFNENKNFLQWNLDLTKSLGTGQIRSSNRGFVISRFFFICFTITGAKNTVRYIEVFVKWRFFKSRFHCSSPFKT